MDKIAVKEDPELTRRVTEGQLPCRIEIVSRNGERKTAATDYPRGHYKNPMSDGEIDNKFRDYAQRRLPAERVNPALATLWKIDSAKNVSGLFEAVKCDG
jgi:2-methylcitrate dehydratase